MRLRKAKLLAFATFLLPVSYVLNGIVVVDEGSSFLKSMFSYYDEFYVLIISIYVIFKKHSILTKNDWLILLVIVITYSIGLISNAYSNLVIKIAPILIDLFTMYKQFLIFIFLRLIVSEREKAVFIKSLLTISKSLVVLTCMLALISQFIDLGMTQGERYGIKAFFFVLGNHSALGILIISCLLIISASNIHGQKFAIYAIFSFLTLILTTKGVIYSFITFSIIMYLISNKGTIKLMHTFVLVGALLIFSSYQINSYLMDANSPRMVFLSESINIADDYAPLGSGFATYGGQQAKINYSLLYTEYDLNRVYGLSEEIGMFLNDNYLALIIGQTGYGGGMLYFLLLYLIFKTLNRDMDLKRRYKILAMAALFMLYVSSIATGIIKSTNGVFLFSIFAILSSHTHDVRRFSNDIKTYKNT